jgi:hypothetical protein
MILSTLTLNNTLPYHSELEYLLSLIHRACTKHTFVYFTQTHSAAVAHASTQERTVSPFSRRSAPMMARAASPVLLEPPWAVPPSFEVDIVGAAGHTRSEQEYEFLE